MEYLGQKSGLKQKSDLTSEELFLTSRNLFILHGNKWCKTVKKNFIKNFHPIVLLALHALHCYYLHLHGVSLVILAMIGKSSLKPADLQCFFVATTLGMMKFWAKALCTQPDKNVTHGINRVSKYYAEWQIFLNVILAIAFFCRSESKHLVNLSLFSLGTLSFHQFNK